MQKTDDNKTTTGRSGLTLTVNLRTGRVFIGAKELSALPELEYRLLTYLYRRKGEICSRDEIIQAVYLDETGITDERLGSLVYRLRNALHEEMPQFPKAYFIKTASRRGYILQNAE